MIEHKAVDAGELVSIESTRIGTTNPVIAFKKLCSLCGFSDIIYEAISHEYICSRCGLVIDTDSLDRGMEWMSFTVGEASSTDRAGPPIIGTFMEKTSTGFYTDLDGRGKTLPLEVSSKMRRLLKQSTKTTLSTPHSRNLSIARSLIRLLVERLNLTESFYKDTLTVYKKALAGKLVVGKTIEGLVAASAYAVCREKRITRSVIEIAETLNLKTVTVAKNYRELVVELHLRPPLDEPSKYVSVYASRLGLGWAVEKRALEILQEVKLRGLQQGRNPRGLSCTAVYIAAKEGQKDNVQSITQKRISKVSGISDMTIRTVLRTLRLNNITSI
jgi:transcription initiation factor TFIIB